MAAQLLDQLSVDGCVDDCLSQRELAVAIAVAGGHELDEVAGWFDASVEAVRRHLRIACRKLAVSSSIELEVLLAPYAC